VVPGAAERILRTLERFGLEWDGDIVRQSERTAGYEAALRLLSDRRMTFECSCSRSKLGDAARYPGYCRDGALQPTLPTALRLRVEPGSILFDDRVQGRFRQDVAAAAGDLIIRRRDGLFAYLLAVVVDDADHRITHVVRGADLLDNTPPQILLQRLLGLPTPAYAHIPLLIEPSGAKLAKSARSVPVDTREIMPTLATVFRLLNLAVPSELVWANPAEAWDWAVQHFRLARIAQRLTLTVA